jgi:AraC-like DNA-binding protein
VELVTAVSGDASVDPAGPEVFDSQDLDEIEDMLCSIWGKMRIGGTGDRTRLQLVHRGVGSAISFDDCDYSFDIAWAASPPDQFVVAEVVANSIALGVDGNESVFGAGDQFMVTRPGLAYEGVARGATLRLTAIDPAMLDQVVLTAESAATEPVRVLDYRPVSRRAQLHLQRTITFLRHQLSDSSDQSPLLIAGAAQYLAACVLRTYPNTADSGPTSVDRRDATGGCVRRAVAYIDANPDLAITLSDIAQAAYVTPRALQIAFRRHLDTTPMNYLRRVRLERVHEDLLVADPNAGATVTEIATRWGFFGLGRFAGYYHAAYGETPSQTLRR